MVLAKEIIALQPTDAMFDGGYNGTPLRAIGYPEHLDQKPKFDDGDDDMRDWWDGDVFRDPTDGPLSFSNAYEWSKKTST